MTNCFIDPERPKHTNTWDFRKDFRAGKKIKLFQVAILHMEKKRPPISDISIEQNEDELEEIELRSQVDEEKITKALYELFESADLSELEIEILLAVKGVDNSGAGVAEIYNKYTSEFTTPREVQEYANSLLERLQNLVNQESTFDRALDNIDPEEF